jgi:hypothetical protein
LPGSPDDIVVTAVIPFKKTLLMDSAATTVFNSVVGYFNIAVRSAVVKIV